jgi:hypothetical protein
MRAGLVVLMLATIACACGPRQTSNATATQYATSVRSPTAAAFATPGGNQSPPQPEGITDPFAYCRVVRDADQPYYLFAPQGGGYAERYRASIKYGGPLYTGETYPFRAGMFARDWQCQRSEVYTCVAFGLVDCTTDRNGWILAHPRDRFERPLPPFKPYDALPSAYRDGAVQSYTDPTAYCLAVGTTDVLADAKDKQTNPIPNRGPQWGGDVPTYGGTRALWRCEEGRALFCPIPSGAGTYCFRRHNEEASNAEIVKACKEQQNIWQLGAQWNSDAAQLYVRGCSGGQPVITGLSIDPVLVDHYGWIKSAWAGT